MQQKDAKHVAKKKHKVTATAYAGSISRFRTTSVKKRKRPSKKQTAPITPPRRTKYIYDYTISDETIPSTSLKRTASRSDGNVSIPKFRDKPPAKSKKRTKQADNKRAYTQQSVKHAHATATDKPTVRAASHASSGNTAPYRKKKRRRKPPLSLTPEFREACVSFGRFFVVAMAAFCIWYGGGNLLNSIPITTIRVEGESYFSEQDIVSASGVSVGDKFFQLDSAEVSRALKQNPYISATVRKVFPCTLIISVTERVECAAIKCDCGYAMISQDGYVLNLTSAPPTPGMICVNGMGTSGLKLGCRVAPENDFRAHVLLELIDALHSTGISDKICSIDITNSFRISLTTTNGVCVYLGDDSSLSEKLELLPDILQKTTASGYGKGTINLSDIKRPSYIRAACEAVSPSVTPVTSGTPATSNTQTLPPSAPETSSTPFGTPVISPSATATNAP